MYALSPVMGMLADRLGAPTVLVGGLGVVVLLTVLTSLSGGSPMIVTIGLILLGFGWSASTVAGGGLAVAGIAAFWVLSRMRVAV